MSKKHIPVEFASSLAVAGPTSDGMVHITFIRQAVSDNRDVGEATRQQGYSSRTSTAHHKAEAVATIMFPYSRFKALGNIFAQVAAEMEENLKSTSTDGQPSPGTSTSSQADSE